MAYLDSQSVQKWLQSTKYDVGVIDQGWEDYAKGVIFGKLQKRYLVTSWLDEDTTPDLVLEIMSMITAANHLRRSASEEDGLTSYADSLEYRAMAICDGIVDGSLVLDGESVDTTQIIGGSAQFFPDNNSTNLFEASKNPDGSTNTVGAAPIVFGMGMEF